MNEDLDFKTMFKYYKFIISKPENTKVPKININTNLHIYLLETYLKLNLAKDIE